MYLHIVINLYFKIILLWNFVTNKRSLARAALTLNSTTSVFLLIYLTLCFLFAYTSYYVKAFTLYSISVSVKIKVIIRISNISFRVVYLHINQKILIFVLYNSNQRFITTI